MNIKPAKVAEVKRKTKVFDLMVPLDEYVTVHDDAFLSDAVRALDVALKEYRQGQYHHRAVLVINEAGQVVGKLSQMDIIRGLEKNYRKTGDLSRGSYHGYMAQFIKNIMGDDVPWNTSLEEMCLKAKNVKVRDIMYTPKTGEYVKANAVLEEAIRQLVRGQHQSLLVLEGKEVVGVLRLTDIFQLATQYILS